MEGAYLPGNIRQRMQELMKEHKITQAQLATRIGSTESAISRFVSGKTDKISTEHLLRIAKILLAIGFAATAIALLLIIRTIHKNRR